MALLAGKLAFVTGAGSGIGRAACLALAKEGAHVIATDINEASAKETVNQMKGSHLSLGLNVSTLTDVETAFNRAISHFGKIPNVAVNSAGIVRDSFLLAMTLEQFKDVIDVNLTGSFIVTKVACTKLVEAGQPGSIINVSSIIGKVGNLGQANYSASKAGVELLSVTVAKEMGRYGIRCNTVMPGFIDTPMTDGVPDKVKSLMMTRIPLKRFGSPGEVAEAITFLASDRSSYISGASIPITGGY